MPGLDEYYKYLDKQDKSTADVVTKNGTAKNGKSKKARLPEGPLPGSVQPGVRYVLKGGVTVAVPSALGEIEALSEPPVAIVLVAAPIAEVVAAPEPVAKAVATKPRLRAADRRSDEITAAPTPIAPEYLPPLVEAAEPTEVADATARPRRARTDPAEEISDGDAAALWKRLPRHIQLLVGMTPDTKEEPAQKYYSRGFKESRQQLIERLLDPTMTLEDTARVLGVCPTTVRRYTNRGVLPHYRTLGQQRRFRLSDVLAFLEKQQKQALKRRKMLFGDKA
ncbi:MAG: helix-turn-helix domain-containing protein [Armatimonadetes bacterium]|nr:helix-turn-helix domain-containing protein [Armatimonadota bacterium]